MIAPLPDELRNAIEQHPNELRLEDARTRAVYVVVEEETHRRAMEALKAQEDWESVQRGLADRERKRELPLDEADTAMRHELGFPPRG